MIPGLRGIEHVGITVPDAEAATRFFVDVLGCEECFKVGPFAAEDDWMSRHLGVDARTRIPQIRMIRCRDGANLEIFEFDAPGPERAPPRNSDPGGHHIAFYVDDMASAVEALRERGLTVLADPVAIAEGPSAGLTWVYFLAPWGLQLELVSYPQGMAFEAVTGRHLWKPAAHTPTLAR